MKRAKRMLVYVALAVLAILTVLVFGLGLHRKPEYIQNFEEEEYGREYTFVKPVSVVDGLAVYTVGSGEPVLLFPYPHGHTTQPMAQGPIADIFVFERSGHFPFAEEAELFAQTVDAFLNQEAQRLCLCS